MSSQTEAMNRARLGETVIHNAAPAFGIPLLVMFFSTETAETAAVFFSVENLTQIFSATGDSFMVNDEGDVLIHPDNSVITSGKTFWYHPLVQMAMESGDRSLQTLYTNLGIEYFGSFRKVSIANAVVITQVASSSVFAGIIATTRRIIFLSGAVLLLSLLAIALFARTISIPIKALAAAALSIENGDYNLKLTHKSSDEIGVLTESFIGMSNGLINFERFTNKAIVKLARQGKLTRTGMTRISTICFALIRDFNELADDVNAKEVVEFVNEYLYRIVPCITMTGGIVDKFLTQGGVVVMALWGAAETTDSPRDDALACMRSVLMMRSALRSLNNDRGRDKKRYIKMGCGINTGGVVAGQMGSDERMEYTVIGDAVNLAARIEGPNDLFDTDILITENIWNLVGDYLVTEEMQSIEVKGKEKPLRVFSVVNMWDEAETEAILAGLEKVPKTDAALTRLCVGPEGPRTLAEVRERWGIPKSLLRKALERGN
jgi:adenylate cyclase